MELRPGDKGGLLCAIRDEAPPEFPARSIANDDRLALFEPAVNTLHAGRKKAAPNWSASRAPSSITIAPFGSSVPAIQRLRAVTGFAEARNQVQGAPPQGL